VQQIRAEQPCQEAQQLEELRQLNQRAMEGHPR
jgi:hypothetical protein